MLNFSKEKKIAFSGVQPTGVPHLGNYLGAIKNWVKLQEEYNCLYCIVDLHAITIRRDPLTLRKEARDALILCLACGLEPDKSIVYFQSHVSAHAELAWVLNCFTYMGELSRMTQFKEKSQKNSENINAGLFTYPVLQASDVLLYQTDIVPVGEDQRQHIELCRDIAGRFNNLYGDVLKIPEAVIPKTGYKIMNLQDPTKKMSKSDDNPNSCVYLLDEPNVILNKFKRAVTDSENNVRFSKEQPGISNLLEIYSVITGKTPSECEQEFAGVGYGDFKVRVGEVVVNEFKPIKERFVELSKDKDYIDKVIKESAENASYIANKTLSRVYKKLGFLSKA